MRHAGPLADELPDDVDVVALQARGKSRWAAMKLAWIIRRYRPRIVHARNFNTWLDAALACRLAWPEVPTLVLGFHGRESPEPFSRRERRRAAWFRLASHPFTSVSHAGRRQLIEQLQVPDDRITVLINGVDTAAFSPPTPHERNEARRTLGLADDEFTILMVSALVPVKDHGTALDALNRVAESIPRCRLLIVGGGPLRGELESRAQSVADKLTVSFLGRLHNPIGALHAADLFLSTSRYEQMSNALLEALACGLPIVATDVGDTARIVEHGRGGLIVPAGDVDAVGRAIVQCAADTVLRQRLGLYARQRVERDFRIEDTSSTYDEFYRSLIRSQQREGPSCAESPASSPIAPWTPTTGTPWGEC